MHAFNWFLMKHIKLITILVWKKATGFPAFLSPTYGFCKNIKILENNKIYI